LRTAFNCAEAGSRLFCVVHLVAFSRLGSVASIAAAPVVLTALTPLVALAVQGAPPGQEAGGAEPVEPEVVQGQEAGGAEPVGPEVVQEQVDLVPADCSSAVEAYSQALTADGRCVAALAEQHSARADSSREDCFPADCSGKVRSVDCPVLRTADGRSVAALAEQHSARADSSREDCFPADCSGKVRSVDCPVPLTGDGRCAAALAERHSAQGGSPPADCFLAGCSATVRLDDCPVLLTADGHSVAAPVPADLVRFDCSPPDDCWVQFLDDCLPGFRFPGALAVE
jgi:hypothetical protein